MPSFPDAVSLPPSPPCLQGSPMPQWMKHGAEACTGANPTRCPTLIGRGRVRVNPEDCALPLSPPASGVGQQGCAACHSSERCDFSLLLRIPRRRGVNTSVPPAIERSATSPARDAALCEQSRETGSGTVQPETAPFVHCIVFSLTGRFNHQIIEITVALVSLLLGFFFVCVCGVTETPRPSINTIEDQDVFRLYKQMGLVCISKNTDF